MVFQKHRSGKRKDIVFKMGGQYSCVEKGIRVGCKQAIGGLSFSVAAVY
jgi:hypothetical protein